MRATLAILTIGVAPLAEIMPLLTEHIREEQITYANLLGKMTREEILEEYSPRGDEEQLVTLLNDHQLVVLSKSRIERDIQAIIEVLDSQGFDVILLMSSSPLNGLTARNAILLDPQRLLPPLVRSIVDGHQMGVIVPAQELLHSQCSNWHALPTPPCYALANPVHCSADELILAGRQLMDDGADVLVLDDCVGFYQRHRDLLQKALNVPVLLSSVLLTTLAVELMS